jgi:hypothetical protein
MTKMFLMKVLLKLLSCFITPLGVLVNWMEYLEWRLEVKVTSVMINKKRKGL